MADRGGRRVANEIAAYGRAANLLRNHDEWENIEFDEAELPPEDDDEVLTHSAVHAYFTANNGMETFTNFNGNQIMDMWRPLNALMGQERRRGPVPLTTTMDHLLLYLVWLKSGQSYAEIAAVFRISETRLEDIMNRVRAPLLEVLQNKWWNPRRRPRYLPNLPVPTAGIIIDGHTTQICVPKLPFEQAKVYFDGKNHIYGLKNEVAVSAHAPHYCLFVSPHFPASVHDYEIHKQVYASYGQYLVMSPEEIVSCQLEPGARYWKILADKGYIGSPDDTEPLERVCPKKGSNLTPNENALNRRLSAMRSVVEMFFGRVARLWHVFVKAWKYDHDHFDTDFTIACLLTNEHISLTALFDQDEHAHKRRLHGWWFQFSEQQRRNREASQRSKAKRRRILIERYGDPRQPGAPDQAP